MAIVQGLLHTLGLYNSPERAKADQERQQQLASATDEADLIKKLALQNQGIASDLGAQYFGESPDDIAQALADKRAALEAQGNGTTVVSYGTNGQPVYGGSGAANGNPAASGAPSGGAGAGKGKLPQGWIDPTDPATIADSYKYYKKDYPNISLEEYTRMVKEANPDGRPRKQLPAAPGEPPKYAAVSDAELADAKKNGSYVPVGAAGGTQHAAITDADRQEAQRQAEANYKNTLPGQLEASRGRRQSAVDSFINDMNGIKSVDAGNYNNAWNVNDKKQYLSPAAQAAQKTAMDKTLALTDTKETAQEKLMREMSRRNQEQTLKSQRDAQASQLRARGAYGSGAELSGFLGAQQEAAQRRSLEEMGANANAQQRAMQALGQYGNQSFQLGQQDLQQGAQQDLNSRFNSQSQQGWQQFKTKTQQQENDAAAKRSASKLDATNQQENVARGDIAQVADRQAQVAGLKTGANISGAQLTGQAQGLVSGALGQSAAQHSAKADSDEDILSF